MRHIKAFVLTLLFLPVIAAWAQDPADTLLQDEDNPTLRFFRTGERPQRPDSYLVVLGSGQSMTLSSFLMLKEYRSEASVLADLDRDGRKELLLYGYTGGAHCCDEITVFRETGPRRYKQVGQLHAGNTVVRPEGLFLFDLYEHFGYFYTCYACGLIDTTDAAPIDVSVVRVNYVKGRLAVIPGDQELRSLLLDNLGKLRELPYVKRGDAVVEDDGQRKAFALNLAVYYFSFGKNLPATRQLFYQYYKFPDANAVWSAFQKVLSEIRLRNSF